MVAVDLQSLISRLNPLCRRSLEAAAGQTLSRTHYNCEIEHWLLQLVGAADADLAAILRVYEIDAGRLSADLTRVLDKLKTGNSRAPALAPGLVSMMREAWVLASLQYGQGAIRSGHLLVALLSDETLAAQARDMSGQFARIVPDALRRDLPKIVADTAEAQTVAPVAASVGGEPAAGGKKPGGPTPNLDQYTIDLTARAKAGKIDPVLGRDGEIRQIIDVLTRRRQNNPILTGEAGVGKTAVVEGFALRIAAGDVPPDLKNVRLLSLDLGLLQAGAGMKGEFENRLKGVIDEVKGSTQPIVMFIDEAHTLIGAGGQAGQNDAANLLKPALARGEMRTVAATTWAEYKKYFEKDPALTRRFQVVKVEEPSEPVAVDMMRGLTETLERHHKVRIVTEGLVEAVRLSSRYIPARQLPDKAVSLLDTACARVAMSQNATPAAIEDRRRTIQLTQTEVDILEREQAIGIDHAEQVAAMKEKIAATNADLAALEERWTRELDLVRRINETRDALFEAHRKAKQPPAEGAEAAEPVDEEALKTQLAVLQDELAEVQGEDPLVKVAVDGQAVAEVVANWTGVPVGRMVSNEIRTILSLADRMKERIIGQDHALDAIAQAMWTSRAKLTDPRKPIGVFLMVGTSGVGKTETALTLADLIYGGEQNVTTINMTEYKEEHKVSLLLGSPPGYVGFGEGGVLTEAVRRRPYSVVLLDELEKAHPGVQDIFFQVFDKGTIKDGEGRDIDFKNTIIIMTSNAGTDLIHKLCADPETMPDADGLLDALRPELQKSFKPAFLGRCTVIPYFQLSDENLAKIVGLQLNRIKKRVTQNYKAEFSYADALVDSIVRRCQEVESGARNIETILNRTLLPDLSSRILARMGEGEPITRVHVAVDDSDQFVYEIA